MRVGMPTVEDVQNDLIAGLARKSVGYRREDTLTDEIYRLNARIARAAKSKSVSEQHRAERLSAILVSRMEALSQIREGRIAQITEAEAKRVAAENLVKQIEEGGDVLPLAVALTSLPVPDIAPPPIK